MSGASTPLNGRSIVVTRASHQNDALRDRLTGLGARVVEMPLLAIVEPDDEGRERDAVLQRFHEFDWIVVTSPNGAERVAPFLRAAVAAGDHSSFPKLAVVGAATQRSLGASAALVADPSRAEVLVQMFPEGSGDVLIVQGNLADDVVPSGLAVKGWNVTTVVAYQTVKVVPTHDQREAVGGADVLLLASSSAASAWHDAFGTSTPAVVVAIGPSTQRTALALGLHVSHLADEQSIDGLVAATVRALA